MSPLTIYLGRFIGIGCLLLCGALAARPKSSLDAITSMMGQPGVLFVTAVFTLAAGVAMVVGHNLWSGGALTIAVTAVGWLALVKGLAILAVPPSGLAAFYSGIGYPQRFRLVMATGLLFSLWLTWAAFTATPSVPV